MSNFTYYKEILDSNQYFFESFIKEFQSDEISKELINGRLSYINYVTDVYIILLININCILQYLDDFFQTYQSKEMIINMMQIGFKLWKELLKDKTDEEQKEQFFIFFFIASCFIVLKVTNFFI